MEVDNIKKDSIGNGRIEKEDSDEKVIDLETHHIESVSQGDSVLLSSQRENMERIENEEDQDEYSNDESESSVRERTATERLSEMRVFRSNDEKKFFYVMLVHIFVICIANICYKFLLSHLMILFFSSSILGFYAYYHKSEKWYKWFRYSFYVEFVFVGISCFVMFPEAIAIFVEFSNILIVWFGYALMIGTTFAKFFVVSLSRKIVSKMNEESNTRREVIYEQDGNAIGINREDSFDSSINDNSMVIQMKDISTEKAQQPVQIHSNVDTTTNE